MAVTRRLGTFSFLGAVVVLGLMVAAGAASAEAQVAPKTVWSGVYTDAQAARGKQVYARACTYCHLDDLSGSLEDNAPALVDSAFADRWRDQSVARMIRWVAGNMPKKGTGALKAQEYLDVVAYLFQANEVPAGAVELPLDLSQLQDVLIVDRPAR